MEFARVEEAFLSLLRSLQQDVHSFKESKDESSLLDTARATALSVSRLADLVDGRVKDVCSDLSLNSDLVEETTDQLRNEILLLLQKAKSSFESPLDFVRRQALTEALQRVDACFVTLESRFSALRPKAATTTAVVADPAKHNQQDQLLAGLKDFGR